MNETKKMVSDKEKICFFLKQKTGQLEEYSEQRSIRESQNSKQKKKRDIICVYVPSLYVPNRDFIFDAVTEELLEIEERNFSKGLNYKNKI